MNCRWFIKRPQLYTWNLSANLLLSILTSASCWTWASCWTIFIILLTFFIFLLFGALWPPVFTCGKVTYSAWWIWHAGKNSTALACIEILTKCNWWMDCDWINILIFHLGSMPNNICSYFVPSDTLAQPGRIQLKLWWIRQDQYSLA